MPINNDEERMQQPENPPKGKVLVLSNSFFAEWRPDIVEETFDSVKDAESWIKEKLKEEPGDLYVIVDVVSLFWAEIQVRKQNRRKIRV